jgi:hypothetical protein
MTAIGTLEFPEISFSEALDIIEKIKSKNIKTMAGLAEELGYSSKSFGGNFYYKLAALSKSYDLISRQRQSISLTGLGQRIAFPLNDEDRSAAINESVSRVGLFRLLFQGLGMNYHDSDFRPRLREVTGASPDQIAREGSRIESLYRDAVKYLKVDAATTAPAEANRETALAPMPSSVVGRSIERSSTPANVRRFEGPVRTIHSEDGYYIQIILDDEVIGEAIAVLEALRNRLAAKTGTLLPTREGM